MSGAAAGELHSLKEFTREIITPPSLQLMNEEALAEQEKIVEEDIKEWTDEQKEQYEKNVLAQQQIIKFYQEQVYPGWKFEYVNDFKMRGHMGTLTSFGYFLSNLDIFPWALDLITPSRFFGKAEFFDRSTLPQKYVGGWMFYEVVLTHISWAEENYASIVNKIRNNALADDHLQPYKYKPIEGGGGEEETYEKLSPETRAEKFKKIKVIAQDNALLLEGVRDRKNEQLKEVIDEFKETNLKIQDMLNKNITQIIQDPAHSEEDTKKFNDLFNRMSRAVKIYYLKRWLLIQEIYFCIIWDMRLRLDRFARDDVDIYPKEADSDGGNNNARIQWEKSLQQKMDIFNTIYIDRMVSPVSYFTTELDIVSDPSSSPELQQLYQANNNLVKKMLKERENYLSKLTPPTTA
jgi:hypothetical protein